MSPMLEIQLIAVFIAAAAALPGVFLILRKMAMISDSITHTILLGIVLGFFITKDLSSPVLIVGASFIGLLTVWLTEAFNKTKLLSEDSSIGLVFPLLFSIAIILITQNANDVHLDTDAVLLGEIAFAPFNRLFIFGIDTGAKALYISFGLFVANALFIVLFYKELMLSSFDPLLCSALGFSPILLHYSLMTSVCITAVGAFEAVGSVLVVAFMIVPPATAYLLTNKLWLMLILSATFGGASGIIGFNIARLFDISIAGCIASTSGLLFLSMLIFSSNKPHQKNKYKCNKT